MDEAPDEFSSQTSFHLFRRFSSTSNRPTKARGKIFVAWFRRASEAFLDSSRANAAASVARRSWLSSSTDSYAAATSSTSWFTLASVACLATAATAATIAANTDALLSVSAAESSDLNSLPA